MIDRPVSKLTAAFVIVGGVFSLIFLPFLDSKYEMSEGIVPIVSGAISAAAIFLFMADKKKDGKD